MVQQIKERIKEVENLKPEDYNLNPTLISDMTFKMQEASTMNE